jgi:phage-related protein
MAPKLPPIGVRAIVENYGNFNKTLDSVNKRIAEAGKKAQAAAKSANPLSKELDKVGLSFQNIKQKVADFVGVNSQALDGLINIGQALGPMGLAAIGAAVGVAALAVGFVSLASRGVALTGVAESFDRLTASVGLSSKALLVDLRKASAGTVSDFALIRQANTALAGASGEFGAEFGKKLPALLELARVQARATGESVEFLFSSLVGGIKRSEPELIDNTGLILKLGAANEKFAEQLGITVEQLTGEQKQMALLNATLEAGERNIAILGGLQETNADKISRANATITNTLDSLSIALQPAFGTLLDLGNRVLTMFQGIAESLAPILGGIASIITTVFSTIFNVVLSVVEPIINAIRSFAPYFAIAFQVVADIIGKVSGVIQNVVGGIVRFLQDVAKNFFGLDLANLGPNLFNGAAAVFGSFANGIIKVANTLIFPAVIGIAQFIADLLIGFSPPKVGPLSQIDKGGENIMLAWLDGIAGVSLDPVEKVAAEVSAALGNIGKANLTQVEARLAELDKSLVPFQNRLDIIKSRFDAIAEPAKAALDAINRQTAEAEAALAGGDQAAAERIRLLDAQREAIQGNVDAQQSIVDRAQVQLSLSQSQQAQERALLNIRKAQLAVTQKVSSVVDKATGAGKPKEEKAKAGEAAPIEAVAGAAPGITTPEGSVLDLFGGQEAVDAAKAGLIDAFTGEIDASALFDFQANSGLLQTQLDRIGSVDLGAKLGEKFKGLTDLFDPSVENSPANVISRFFGDASVEGSLAGFVQALPDKISAAAHGLGESIGTSLRGMFVFLTGEEEGSLKYILATLTGDASVEGSVANFFSLLPARVAEAASSLFTELDTHVFAPVRDFLTGSGPGTLSGIIEGAIFFFEQLPSQVLFALAGFAQSIYGALVSPVIGAVNGLIGLVESAIKGFIGGIADFIQGIVDGLADFAPQFLRDAAANLRSTANGVSFGRISTDIPDFLKAAPAAATGGMFTKGLIKVGERGPEYIGAASRVGILPAEITRALEGLGSILAAPAPMMVPGNSYVDDHSSQSSLTANFYGQQDPQSIMRRMSLLQARRR